MGLSSKRRPALAGLAVVVAAALSGCAGMTSASTAPPTRAQLASADALRILDAAPVLSKAVPNSTCPKRTSFPGSPNLVDLHRCYFVRVLPANLDAVLRPNGGTGLSTSTSNVGLSSVGYSLAATPVLDSRGLLYTFEIAKDGYDVRVDAQVTWLPAKPHLAHVAPGASAIVVRLTGNGSGVVRSQAYWNSLTRTARVTSASAIASITAQVNALAVIPPGVRMCPAGGIMDLSLAFERSGWAHPYATVQMTTGGCSTATITQFNRAGTSLGSARLGGGDLYVGSARAAGITSIPTAYPAR